MIFLPHPEPLPVEFEHGLNHYIEAVGERCVDADFEILVMPRTDRAESKRFEAAIRLYKSIARGTSKRSHTFCISS